MATKEQIEKVAKRLFDRTNYEEAVKRGEGHIVHVSIALARMWDLPSFKMIRLKCMHEAEALLDGIELTRDVEHIKVVEKPVVFSPFTIPPADRPFNEWLREQGWPSNVIPMAMNSKSPIEPGESVTISEQPDITCRPFMWIVERFHAEQFELIDMRAGNSMFIMGRHGISCDIFKTPNSLANVNDNAMEKGEKPIFITMPTINPAQAIRVQVKNISNTPCTFRSCFIMTIQDESDRFRADALSLWEHAHKQLQDTETDESLDPVKVAKTLL